jgi:hypothetical protein
VINETDYHHNKGPFRWSVNGQLWAELTADGFNVSTPDEALNVARHPYYAVGDSSNDDYSNIQRALDVGDGKTIFLPRKTGAYRVRQKLTLPANVRIKSNGATVLFDFPVSTSTADGLLMSLTGSNVDISGVTFDGSGLSGTLAGNRYAIGYEPVGSTRIENVKIRDCEFTNLSQSAGTSPGTTEVMHAIYMRQVDDLLVENNKIDTISGAGVFLTDTERARVVRNKFKLHGWAGVWLHNSNQYWEIAGNDFFGSTSGSPVYWGGAIDVMGEGGADSDGDIHGNKFIAGYFRYGAVLRLLSSRRVIVARNQFFGCDVDNDTNDESNLIVVGVRDNVTNWGAWQDIAISNNQFQADGAGIQKAVTVLTTSGNNANTTACEGLSVTDNRFIKQDGSNYFGQAVRIHGGNAGINGINVSGNKGHCKPGTNLTYTTIPGAIVVDSLSGKTVDRVSIVNNDLEYDGAGSTNNHAGVYIGADVTNEEISLNQFKNFYRSIWYVGTPTRLPFRNTYQVAAGGSSLVTGAAVVVNPTSDALVASSVALVDGITAPSTAAGLALQYVDTSDGDLKEKFGDGTTKVVSADT